MQMVSFKSIFKGKERPCTPQDTELTQQYEILEEHTDIRIIDSEPADTVITESDPPNMGLEESEDPTDIEMTKFDATKTGDKDEISCADGAENFPELLRTEKNYANLIPEDKPAFLQPSPEAYQIRTLMNGFDSGVRDRYEAKCNANAHAGSILVEFLEQYKVFEESALISHGQQRNMSHLTEYIQSCIEDYVPSNYDDDDDEESFEKNIRKVIKCLQTLGDIARSYAEPGWVYRLAIDSSLTERIEKLTHEINVSFQRLGHSDNKGPKIENMHKILLDNLKSCGSGSWSTGLITLRENREALQRLATYLAISNESMMVEAYLNMNLPWALRTLSAKDVRKEESIVVFMEYCDSIGKDGSTNLLSTIGFEKYWVDSSESGDLTKCTEEASKMFVKLDSDFDGLLTADDFETAYLQKGVSAAKSLIRRICGVSGERKMRHTFDLFAMFGMGGHSVESKVLSLDSARFAKLCRDSNIISRPNHTKELDIVFSKCVPHNCRKMDYEHFLASVSRMSIAIDLSLSQLCKRIMSCAGPTSRCTKSAYVKLHDDRSLFTGIYARGGPDVGPTTVDMKAFVGRVKPKEVTTPETLEITLPESPTMATASRITSPGSRTPGRGASLEACEMRKSREMMNSNGSKGKKGKKFGSSVAFGRASDQKCDLARNEKNEVMTDRSMLEKDDSVKIMSKCIEISATMDVHKG